MKPIWILIFAVLLGASVSMCSPGSELPAQGSSQTGSSSSRQSSRPPQTREHGERVSVDPKTVVVDDGDTVIIQWSEADEEIVRILGIDTPETRHLPHNIPYSQAFGHEAQDFATEAFAAAGEIEILRADRLDPFQRSLAYLFLDGTNYSVTVVSARLAVESVSQYGDNGFPDEAAAVVEASQNAGPVPFENPGDYRRRMREVTEWMKEQGTYPTE